MGYWARRRKGLKKVLELCDEPMRTVGWRECCRCRRVASREISNDKTIRTAEHIHPVSIRPPEIGRDVLIGREVVALRFAEVQPCEEWNEELT
jgi:hypothetical protein